MTKSLLQIPAPAITPAEDSRLDLVVPFTTPHLTQDALSAANRLGANLHARIRLVRVVVVPYPLNLNEPPVPAEFLLRQMEHFTSSIPAECEIRLARDGNEGLRGCLKLASVVILATKKRPWKTRTERLGDAIRHQGHAVVMVDSEPEN